MLGEVRPSYARLEFVRQRKDRLVHVSSRNVVWSVYINLGQETVGFFRIGQFNSC
jgi:hypothetical protein